MNEHEDPGDRECGRQAGCADSEERRGSLATGVSSEEEEQRGVHLLRGLEDQRTLEGLFENRIVHRAGWCCLKSREQHVVSQYERLSLRSHSSPFYFIFFG